MLELQGIAVSPGVAIGRALVFDREGYRITRCLVKPEESDIELHRLVEAVGYAREKLESTQLSTKASLGDHLGSIFSAQQQILVDPNLQSELESLIRKKSYSAEYAVSEVFTRYAAIFRKSPSTFLAERANDVRDVERLLLEQLTGQPMATLTQLPHEAIVVSHDLTPGETAAFDREKVLGICTEAGGPGGHTAIVARGMEIPAVVGVGNFLHNIRSGDEVIVDGHLGRIIVSPDPETKDRYLQRRLFRQSIATQLEEIRDLPATTSDGVRIELMANLEFPHEAAACLARGADGVGLYRTEFLYLGHTLEPSEEEHYEAYAQVVRDMQNRPVVIRTLDLGADKMGMTRPAEPENNPFLGLRSIRLSLRNPALFRIQLRAILRAACLGDVRVMFPMITTLDELRNARFLLRSVSEDLLTESKVIPCAVQVGMMVEVPAAVLMLDRFIEEIDFVSIGTNDLTQYTLAVDRSNDSVVDLYQACDPAVLRLIEKTQQVASKHNKSTSVCGEMSNNPAYALLLVGMGIRTLSIAPAAIPILKKAIRSVTIGQCEAMAWRALRLDTAREVDAFLMNQLAGLVPEIVLQA
ncbi:MAG: phosphoenolpyruvate--protein phosphotransferase [Pirellula sp.]|jgi:phosphotransferase system enzyme I (PtsI)|nr:phosphoenolpyruvate--protein phosphotransferase [Planctomycetota bacterium]